MAVQKDVIDNAWAGPEETFPGASPECSGCNLSRAGFCLRYPPHLNFTPDCINERKKK